MRIDSERPRKTPRGVILGTSVGMTTSDVHMDVQPRFGKSSILNQLCVPSMSAESTEHALATKHLLIAMGSRRATPNFHRLDCINRKHTGHEVDFWRHDRFIRVQSSDALPWFPLYTLQLATRWCAVPVGGAAWPAARCSEHSDPILLYAASSRVQ